VSTTSTPLRPARALASEDGEARWFLGSLATVKLTGADTEGQFSLVEMVGAKGDMPPLHVHHTDDETFLLIEGELSFYVGGQVLRGEPGSMLFAPRGIPHAYRVESETARWRVTGLPRVPARGERPRQDPDPPERAADDHPRPADRDRLPLRHRSPRPARKHPFLVAGGKDEAGIS